MRRSKEPVIRSPRRRVAEAERYLKLQRFRSLEVHHKLELGRLLDRQPVQLYVADYCCLVFLLPDAALVRRDTAPPAEGTTALNANCFARLAILSPAMNLSSDCRSV